MKTFTMNMTAREQKDLDELTKEGGTKASLMRFAICLLHEAVRARQQGLRLTLSNDQYQVVREIVIPGLD